MKEKWESKGEGSICERNSRNKSGITVVSQDTPEVVKISDPLIKSLRKVTLSSQTLSAFAFF